MEQLRPESVGNPFAFDSVCGAPVDDNAANQFFDGERTFYFCSAYCRRLFLDQLHLLQAAGLLGTCAAAAVPSVW